MKRILSVSVIPLGDPNDPLSSFSTGGSTTSGSTVSSIGGNSGSNIGGSQLTFLKDAYAEMRKTPEIKSMLEKKTLFDTIFSEVLSQPGRIGFTYLLDCFTNTIGEKDKGVNKDPKI